ncbi:hypothetical protein [Streptomyces sp. NPDC001435]|uniref:hypothetical protein n=1 Tax=unclassified Streptomyces TaxID=2593676 RepID=UPI00369EA7F4
MTARQWPRRCAPLKIEDPDKHVTAMDVDPYLTEVATERLADRNQDVQFGLADRLLNRTRDVRGEWQELATNTGQLAETPLMLCSSPGREA